MKLKKLFTSMAVTALALGSMFMTAMADDSYAYLYVSGTEYDAMEDQSGEGWSWDVDTLTLTLDGFEGTDIHFDSDLTSVVNLVIEGTNTVESYNNSDAVAMYSNLGEFTVSGDGTLNVTYADDDAISFNDGESTVSFSDVAINMIEVSYGIYAGDVTMDGLTISADEVINDVLLANSLEITDTEISAVNCGSDLFDVYESVSVSDSKITVNDTVALIATYSEDGEVIISDSEITGDTYYPFSMHTFTVENSIIDLEVIESMFVNTFEIVDSEVTLVGEHAAFAYVENLNITDSEVYFENIEATGFQVGSMDDYYNNGNCGFVNYTFTYTTPEYWGLYLDGELSEDYTVESTDIVFGEKILEIRYVHECTFDEYVSDGADTHTATCECGETDTADHTWDDGVVTKEAAVDVAGETTYTCTVCGETKTEAIDALVATPDEATPEDADPTQPDTGDNGIVALVGLMLLAGAGVVAASKKRA